MAQTLDADGYPSDEDLETITKWPCVKFSDMIELMEFARQRWNYDGWREEDVIEYGHPRRQYTISTYGWSGNESVINALELNQMFSMIAPYSWQRGGHYVYRIPLEANDVPSNT